MPRFSRKKLIIGLIIILLGVVVFVGIRLFKERREAIKEAEAPPSLSERLGERPRLSASGQELKQKLIEPLGGPGPLYETADFRVGWVPPPVDTFEVQIKTTNVVSAKEQTIAWLKSKGFIEPDICALPVVFILDWNVRQELEGSGYVFNPLPDFCQY